MLKKMRREHFSDFLFLLETKNSSSHVAQLHKWLGYDNILIVDPKGLSGGLALLWKVTYDISIINLDKRVIDVSIKLGSLKSFISFVYGDPARHLRQHVLDSLIDIGAYRNEPWLVIGD